MYMRIEFDSNQLAIVISKDELSTNFEEINKNIDKYKQNKKFVLVITCPKQNKKADVPYAYQPAEVNKLLYLNRKIEQAGHHDCILFNEGIDLPENKDSNTSVKCWTLSIVLEVNKKIDHIVQKIKDLRLTPYETMLYIHELASKFKYSGSAKTHTMSRESEATLLGLSDEYKHFCCVGYASFVKAIIDRLDTPDLVAYVDQFNIFHTDKSTNEPGFVTGHVTNLIRINDPYYGIQGTYFEDATGGDDTSFADFSTCLLPIPDMQHFKSKIYRHVPFEDSKSSIHKLVYVEDKIYNDIEGCPDYFRNSILKVDYEWLPFQDTRIRRFTKNLQYKSYPIEAFENAYRSLLAKLGEKNTAEKIGKAMEIAVLNAGFRFDERSESCFAKDYYESYQYYLANQGKGI